MPVGSPPPTVLVIEDDPNILDILLEGLSDEGYRTVGAANLADAVAGLAMGRFDVILADAFRPLGLVVAGEQWAILESLRRAARATPIVIITAHEISDYADFREHGFAGVLAKPFDLDELYAAVRRVLG